MFFSYETAPLCVAEYLSKQMMVAPVGKRFGEAIYKSLNYNEYDVKPKELYDGNKNDLALFPFNEALESFSIWLYPYYNIRNILKNGLITLDCAYIYKDLAINKFILTADVDPSNIKDERIDINRLYKKFLDKLESQKNYDSSFNHLPKIVNKVKRYYRNSIKDFYLDDASAGFRKSSRKCTLYVSMVFYIEM